MVWCAQHWHKTPLHSDHFLSKTPVSLCISKLRISTLMLVLADVSLLSALAREPLQDDIVLQPITTHRASHLTQHVTVCLLAQEAVEDLKVGALFAEMTQQPYETSLDRSGTGDTAS